LKKLVVILLVLSSLFSSAQPAFDSAISSYKQWLLAHDTTNLDSIAAWQKSLNENGQWPDIDYANQFSSAWVTVQHLARVRSLAVAWVDAKNRNYQNKQLYKSINSAIDHWLENKYINPNWWYNEIGVPQYWRDILGLMMDNLSSDQKKEALALLGKYNVRPNFTGANLAWSADLMLHDGLFTKDEAKVKKAKDLIIKEIKVSKGEGIQPDYSFHQHGARLQTHHYGNSFLMENIRLAWELRKTPWAFPQQKINTLIDFALKGWQWMARGVYNSPATIDRSISRLGTLKAADLRHHLPYLIEIAGSKKIALHQMLETQNRGTQTATGFRYFPYSDFASYQQKEYSFFLKTISTRTETSEMINKENKKGTFLNFGDLYIIKNGNEYLDLMPVWDWKKLPGQTLFSEAEKIERQPFAGGISNGESGFAAMAAKVVGNDKALTVSKLWAFYKGKMICLIAGLESANGIDSVYTVLDQCRLQGAVIANNTSNILTYGTTTLDSVKWLYHNGLAYVPIGGHTMEINVKKAVGTWLSLTAAGSPKTVSESVFMPITYHQNDASFAYFIAPAKDPEDANQIASQHGFAILKNNKSFQIIKCDANVYMAAFHEAVSQLEITKGSRITVDRPCLVMLDGNILYAADPLHIGGLLNLTYNNRSIKIQLPPDGTSATFSIKK